MQPVNCSQLRRSLDMAEELLMGKEFTTGLARRFALTHTMSWL